MPFPEYHGGSIVNLMQSLIAARGRPGADASPYPPAPLLPAETIAEARHVVLLVLDGLGDLWLRRHRPDGLLARHRAGALTSVFPSTTASAITTYLTGDAPQQHGLTGWYVWLAELGCALAVLPGTPRYGGIGYREAGIDVGRLFGHRSWFERLATPSAVVSPRHIAHSEFNLAHLGPAALRPYEGLDELTRTLLRCVRSARVATTIYAYWPGLDTRGHEHGMDSPETAEHLLAIERGLHWLVERLRGQDTLLLVTADHGQLDAADADRIDLAQTPELVDCLAMPLCGEPRTAYCYVRQQSNERFEALWAEHLQDRFALHRSSDLVADGLFGLGAAHPRLHQRIGDYTLLAKDRAVLHQRLPFDKPFDQIGAHGGLSADEMMVPLCLFQC